jgi:formate dehydrogenase subunit gamma
MHAMTARRLLGAALLAGLGIGNPAWAEDSAVQPAVPPVAAATAGPPAGFVAPAEPKAEETNAQRGKTQPGNNAPLWRAVRESGSVAGVTTASGAEAGTLIQSFTQYPGARYATAGEAWRQVRNNWIIPYGSALLLIAVLAIGLFHWRRGPMGGHVPDTGRKIERFTYFERAAHWSVAIAFVVLAVSGLVMAFGKFFLLPVIGGTLFGWLTYALKTAHNFAGPVFAVALIILIITYVRDNIPSRGDLAWLADIAKGGLASIGPEVPSHRFNAGEKIVFWGGVILLGLVVVGSGLVLDKLLPALAYTRGDMQVAHMIHAVASVLMMALFCGHIYLGTIGMKGAYQGMRTGYVDEGWAKEHHELWYADIKAGKIPAQRSPVASLTPPGTTAAQQN